MAACAHPALRVLLSDLGHHPHLVSTKSLPPRVAGRRVLWRRSQGVDTGEGRCGRSLLRLCVVLYSEPAPPQMPASSQPCSRRTETEAGHGRREGPRRLQVPWRSPSPPRSWRQSGSSPPTGPVATEVGDSTQGAAGREWRPAEAGRLPHSVGEPASSENLPGTPGRLSPKAPILPASPQWALDAMMLPLQTPHPDGGPRRDPLGRAAPETRHCPPFIALETEPGPSH